jgi:hypothetical protein
MGTNDPLHSIIPPSLFSPTWRGAPELTIACGARQSEESLREFIQATVELTSTLLDQAKKLKSSSHAPFSSY